MKRDKRRRFAPRLAAAALVAATLGSFSGWLFTVRQFNEQAAYQAAGAEALHARAAASPVARLAED